MTANGSGAGTLARGGGLSGPRVTATATDAAGNTSEFSDPVSIRPGCGGDCDSGGAVIVDELLIMVNIALGIASPSACPADDANHDGEITIDDIFQAVNHALGDCPSSA